MTKPPTRGSLLRKIERLEKQIRAIETMRLIDAQSWRDIAIRCTDAEVRVRWALSILQTGELPEGQSWPTRCSPRPQPSGQRGAGQRQECRRRGEASLPRLDGAQGHAQRLGGLLLGVGHGGAPGAEFGQLHFLGNAP